MPSFSLWSVLNRVRGEQEAEEDRHRERVDAEYAHAQAHDERLSDEEAEKQREEYLACARRARAAQPTGIPKGKKASLIS